MLSPKGFQIHQRACTNQEKRPMTEKTLEQRIKDLETEYKKSQQMLQQLEAQKSRVTENMLRNQGAIAALREELEAQKESEELDNEAEDQNKAKDMDGVA